MSRAVRSDQLYFERRWHSRFGLQDRGGESDRPRCIPPQPINPSEDSADEMSEIEVGSLFRAEEPEMVALQSELASLSEQLREANKAKEEAEEYARASAAKHAAAEEFWSSTNRRGAFEAQPG